MLVGTRRTVFIILLHAGITLLHSLGIAYTESKAACHAAPLSDVVHALQANGVAPFRWFSLVNPDVIIALHAAMLLGVLIVSPARHLLLRRFFFFHSVVSLVRGVLVTVTVLPSVRAECLTQVIPSDRLGERAVSLTLSAMGIDPAHLALELGGRACCDNIISGHTSFLLVLAVLLGFVLRAPWMRALIITSTSLGVLSIVQMDRHYTVDVLNSLVVIGALLFVYVREISRSQPTFLVRFVEEKEYFSAKRAEV
jgi:hypothetical protein